MGVCMEEPVALTDLSCRKSQPLRVRVKLICLAGICATTRSVLMTMSTRSSMSLSLS